uniref:hypothetical protein n=1 Tax=uncultured Draconibacterium sp. TaxID=1573823 RepID=UPI0032171629
MKKGFKGMLIIGILSLIICVSCDKKPDIPREEEEVEDIDIVFPERPAHNTNRLFIKHGLQLSCWVGSEDLIAERVDVGYYVIDPNDWRLSGFTGATFFTAPAPFNKYFTLNEFPDTQWSMAKAPYGKHLDKGPTDYEMRNGFLNPDQKSALSRLATMCVGDEENYSHDIVKWTKQWYDVARTYYPDVLLHNNQWGYGGQWTETQMRYYIQTAKPDLLTFDAYYFLPIGEKISYYRGAKAMANDLMMYRELAMEGCDGSGEDPLAFGQYTQGYKQDGTYKISESELRLYYSMTWAFGGKWLNWFRWLQGNNHNGVTTPTSWAMLLENGMPGQPTKYMDWVAICNAESKAIGDHLVRLQTHKVSFVTGDSELTNGKPERVNSWYSSNGQIINEIKSSCISGEYEGKKGDLYLGTFNVISAERNGDPDFFASPQATYFMIVNAFTTNKDESAETLTQKVEFDISNEKLRDKSLYRISKETGTETELQGIKINDKFRYTTEIIGGGFDFFVLR